MSVFPVMGTTSSPKRHENHEINRMSHHNESFWESSFSNKAIGLRRKIDKNFQVGSDHVFNMIFRGFQLFYP